MKKKNIIIAIIVVMMLIIAGVIIPIKLLKNKPIEKRDYYTINNNVITEAEAKKLIETIPFSNTTIGELKDAYSGSYTTQENIKEMILSMAYIGNFKSLLTSFTDDEKTEIAELLDGEETTRRLVTLRSKIDNILESNYNTNISKLQISEINDKLYFKELSDKYVIIGLNTASTNFLKDVYGYSIKEVNGDLIIDENTLFVEQINTTFNFYSDTSINKKALKIESASYEQLKVDYMEDLAKIITTFRHTFKKNNGNYYWYSTEKTN